MTHPTPPPPFPFELLSYLEKEVYVSQPHGFVKGRIREERGPITYFMAPCVCFQKVHAYLNANGIQNSTTKGRFYVCRDGNHLPMLILYMDDMHIASHVEDNI